MVKMRKTPIESAKIQSWNYERFQFQSKVLAQDFRFGVFHQAPLEQVDTTLYLLHGGGADDTQAVQAGLLTILVDLLTPHPYTQVVLPFVGNSFLHDHPTEDRKSFSKYFLNELLPLCEQGTKTESKSRYLSGWSMGGHAALNMFMRYPHQFAGAGAHFPTLIAFDYNHPKQAAEYAQRMNVTQDMMNILIGDLQREFVDKNDFAAHNPLELAKKAAANEWAQKKIYFDVGSNDDFGLQEGGQALSQILQQKNIPHHFESVPQGRHDAAFLHGQFSKLIHHLL